MSAAADGFLAGVRFAGDEPVDGQAAPGTVRTPRVRFRPGRPDRGTASARVAPTLGPDAA